MNPETILDIVLSSLLGTMQLSVYATCVIWRARKYRKGLHHTAKGLIALFISMLFGIFLPIGGFTFLDGGSSGTRSLIIGLVICPIALVFALNGICFCIFLNGHEVVKRTLFSETKVDLRDPETFIDDPVPRRKYVLTSIVSAKSQIVIQFESLGTEGDLTSFLEDCKKELNH